MRWFVSLLIAAILVLDFFPHHGPPHFRYTGSDPGRHVFNIGWPMALFIYDPQTGVHVGPFAYALIPGQVVVLAIVVVALVITRRIRNRGMLTTA